MNIIDARFTLKSLLETVEQLEEFSQFLTEEQELAFKQKWDQSGAEHALHILSFIEKRISNAVPVEQLK